MRRSIPALTAVAQFLFMYAAHATGVWVASRTGELTVVLGEGAGDDAYSPSQVLKVTGADSKGQPVPVALKPQARNVIVEPGEGTASLAVTFDDGLWGEDADGNWFVVTGNRARDPKLYKHRFYRYNTTILAPLSPSAIGKAHGLKLEIVPLLDPLTLKVGDKLPVRVLLDGKPLAGVSVVPDYISNYFYTDQKSLVALTDRYGKAMVPIRNGTLNVLWAWYGDEVIEAEKEVYVDANKDGFSEGYSSTLAFVLPE